MKLTENKIRRLIKESIKLHLHESSYKDLPEYEDTESARDAIAQLKITSFKDNPIMQKEIIRSTLAFANNFGLKKIKSYGAGSGIFFDKIDTWKQGGGMAVYWNHLHKNQPNISEEEAQINIDEKLVKKALKEIQKNLEFMGKIQKDFNYDILVSLSTPEKILKEVILVQYDSILKDYENKIKSQKNINFETLVSWSIMEKLTRSLKSNIKELSHTIKELVKHRMLKQIQSKATRNPDVFKREDFFVIHYIGAFAGSSNVFDRVISFIPTIAGKTNKNEQAGVLYHKSVKELSDSIGKSGQVGIIIDGYITAVYRGDIRSTRYDSGHKLSGGKGIGGFTGREETGFARYAGDGAGTMASESNIVLNPNQLVKDGELFSGGYSETFFDNWKVGGLICDWQKAFSDKDQLGKDIHSAWNDFQKIINEYKITLYDKNFNKISLNDISKMLEKTLSSPIKNK